MRVTSKGQVTIPQEIRERFGFMPETEIDFVVDDEQGRVYIIQVDGPSPRKTRGELLVEHLQRHGPGPGLTTDEIMALTRGEDWRG
jgi:AbrB family looped-hinge helix DNA binding protein